MINSVYNQICKSIKKEFKSSNIFGTPIKNGFKKGDFTVELFKTLSSPVPGKYLKQTLTFSVKRFSEDKQELYDGIEKLENALGILSFDSGIMLRGYINKVEIKETEFDLTVDYSYLKKGEESADLMEELVYEKV